MCDGDEATQLRSGTGRVEVLARYFMPSSDEELSHINTRIRQRKLFQPKDGPYRRTVKIYTV